jgi:hypothetical protein
VVRLGVATPRIVIRRVERIERVGVASKLKRFVGLDP